MRNRNGFTMIELVVVVTVLGILLGIMIPGVAGYMARAKEKECAVNRKAILLELDAKRVLDPGAELAEVISEFAETIHCPEQAAYIADGNRVKCPIHGEDSAFADEVETIGEIVEIETAVVSEPEDRPESTEVPTPTEPTGPTEPTEPEGPTEPEKPVIVDGELLHSSLHPELTAEEIVKKTKRGNLYYMEKMDGSFVLVVGVYPTTWDGLNSSWLWGNYAIVDYENPHEPEEYFTKGDQGNWIAKGSIPLGLVIRDPETGKLYTCFNNSFEWGGSTSFQNGGHWVEIEMK